MEVVSLSGLFVGLVRSVDGWARKSLRDRRITRFEWVKLFETLLRVLSLHAAIYFGGESVGLQPDIVSSAFAAFLADKVLKALKEKKQVRGRRE